MKNMHSSMHNEQWIFYDYHNLNSKKIDQIIEDMYIKMKKTELEENIS